MALAAASSATRPPAMLPTTMKAAVARAGGQTLQIEQVPVPTLTAGHVSVEAAACGICHPGIVDAVLTRRTVRSPIVGAGKNLTESLTLADTDWVKEHYPCWQRSRPTRCRAAWCWI